VSTRASAPTPIQYDGFQVELQPSARRADIVLNRTPLNIVTISQREQLRAAIEEFDNNDAIQVIVLRAVGEHFSSGGYIKGFVETSPEYLSRLADNIAAPERCRKPVIAAIHGYCFGVAFELSLACDFRIVTASSLLALPEQHIGMIPGSGGSARLLHMIGIGRTKDMVMRGRRITGTEAHDWGIAIDCVADESLAAATDSLVKELTTFSPLAQRTLKYLLNTSQNTSVQAGTELEGQAFGQLRSSNDFHEGVAAFHEKRKPEFTGS
jgi:2-oxoglutaroyl-CoA hydrolase